MLAEFFEYDDSSRRNVVELVQVARLATDVSSCGPPSVACETAYLFVSEGFFNLKRLMYLKTPVFHGILA